MSNSRKLKFRTVPRTPRYLHNKHAEPIPLANRFQELIEQDERSPSPTGKLPAQRLGLGISTSPPTPSMAQRLQDLLEKSESKNNGSSSHNVEEGVQRNGNVAGGAEALRNDESETVDSDTSDHEDWTKSSAKVVLPMGQRLHELLQADSPASTQEKSKPRQKGKRPIESNLELKSAFREDDIEAYDNVQTGTHISPPAVTKPHSLPRISEQFQEALMAAPSFDSSPLPSVQFPVDQDYSTRLQRIIQLEKQQCAEISKGLSLDTSVESIQVQVKKKSLEGRLTTCKCQVIKAPSKWMDPSLAPSIVDQVQVIFNSKVAAELEVDVGCKVQINPPWREVTLLGSTTRVILCTYFCEIVY